MTKKPERIETPDNLALVEPSHPVLLQVADKIPVEDISNHEIQQLIDDMLVIGQGEQGDPEKRYMVGLAAPQVGVSKRIILVALGQSGDKREITPLEAFINPEIIYSSDEAEEWREGCYSVPQHMAGVVRRPKEVTIHAYNRKGEAIEQSLDGYEARIFQHEIDHLDGVIFIDRITDQSKLHLVKPSDQKNYRENWRSWDETYTRDEFERARKLT